MAFTFFISCQLCRSVRTAAKKRAENKELIDKEINGVTFVYEIFAITGNNPQRSVPPTIKSSPSRSLDNLIIL